MQVNNLNKTINLFITSSFSLFSFFLLDSYQESCYFDTFSNNFIGVPTTFQVVIGIVFFPVLIFLGLIIESLTSLLRGGVKKLIKIPKIENWGLQLLFKKSDKIGYDFWKKKFEGATKKMISDDLLFLNEKHIYNDKLERSELASPILFNFAPGHYVDWVTRHHATYMLATNLIVVLVINLILIFIGGGLKNLFIVFIVIMFIYFLASLALDNFYYAYSLMYRFGVVKIEGEKIDSKILEKK